MNPVPGNPVFSVIELTLIPTMNTSKNPAEKGLLER